MEPMSERKRYSSKQILGIAAIILFVIPALFGILYRAILILALPLATLPNNIANILGAVWMIVSVLISGWLTYKVCRYLWPKRMG
jgi:hypothetical protein